MRLKLLTTISLWSCTAWVSVAQNDNKILDYIKKYKDLAVQEQLRTGVPASIKLAQGIFETASGQSELSVNANNHFGIKCKNTWTGLTYTYTDDRKDECFRMYTSDVASYQDHSDFLMKNPRYATLFTYAVDDYKSWAHGLKKAGYATNPSYAQRVIDLIEKYELNQYTLVALNGSKPAKEAVYAQVTNSKSVSDVPVSYVSTNEVKTTRSAVAQEVKPEPSKEYYITKKKNNLKGFDAPKGAMLLDYAIKNKVRYNRLLEWNDLPDAPLEADMFIYLERKHAKAQDMAQTIVGREETALQVSQRTGVQLEQLRLMNKLVVGVEPKPGATLYLQEVAESAPEVYIPSTTSKTTTATVRSAPVSDAGYIVVNKKDVPENKELAVATEDEIVLAQPGYKVAEEKAPTPMPSGRVSEHQVAVAAPSEGAYKQPESNTKKDDANDKNLSPYERLKKHMDKQVDNKGSYYENTAPATNEPTPTYANDDVTVAARKSRPVNVTKVADTKPKTTPTKTANTKTANTKAAAPKFHTVKKGETLTSIASKYNVSVKDLQAWNKVTPKTLQAGKKLKLTK